MGARSRLRAIGSPLGDDAAAHECDEVYDRIMDTGQTTRMLSFVAAGALAFLMGPAAAAAENSDNAGQTDESWPRAMRVIITLDVAKGDGKPDPGAIRKAQDALAEAVEAKGHAIRGMTRYGYMPLLAGRVDAPTLLYLLRDAPQVEAVNRDRGFELHDDAFDGTADDTNAPSDDADIGLAVPMNCGSSTLLDFGCRVAPAARQVGP